jgi:hypothetical protein
MSSDSFYKVNKIFVAALSYNRANIFKKSMLTLVKSLIYSNAIENAQVAVFDDGSDKSQLTIINNYCLELRNKFNLDINLYKTDKNRGYGINYMKGVDWYVSQGDRNALLYIHETDLILEKKWFYKCNMILNSNTNWIISPVHHINHLNYLNHAHGMHNLFKQNIEEAFLQKNEINIQEMILNEGKTVFNDKSFVAKISYGLIGARLASSHYWQKVIQNKEFIFSNHDKEDMALSFIGKNSCLYLIPGSAKIAFKPGLHGYMFLNIASYDIGLNKFIFFVNFKRYLIKSTLKLLNKIGLMKILKKLFIKN